MRDSRPTWLSPSYWRCVVMVVVDPGTECYVLTVWGTIWCWLLLMVCVCVWACVCVCMCVRAVVVNHCIECHVPMVCDLGPAWQSPVADSVCAGGGQRGAAGGVDRCGLNDHDPSGYWRRRKLPCAVLISSLSLWGRLCFGCACSPAFFFFWLFFNFFSYRFLFRQNFLFIPDLYVSWLLSFSSSLSSCYISFLMY